MARWAASRGSFLRAGNPRAKRLFERRQRPPVTATGSFSIRSFSHRHRCRKFAEAAERGRGGASLANLGPRERPHQSASTGLDYSEGPAAPVPGVRDLSRPAGTRRPPARAFCRSHRPTRGEDVEALPGESATSLNAFPGWVKGRHAEHRLDPIRYIHSPDAAARAASLFSYRTARVGLVTPLIDGMNLVAKRSTSPRKNPREPGPFWSCRGWPASGRGHDRGPSPSVNPYDLEDMAVAIDTAPHDAARGAQEAPRGELLATA